MATKNVNTEAVQTDETEKKEAVNILDLLLGSDVGEIKLPTKEVEITRLSQVYGAPFILTIKAITPAKFEEIQDMSIDVKGKDADIDITQEIYEKDEYIQLMAEKNSSLEEQATDLQLALADVYEQMLGLSAN